MHQAPAAEEPCSAVASAARCTSCISPGLRPCFMSPEGVGSWHEWPVDHLVALLGCVLVQYQSIHHLPGQAAKQPIQRVI